jgi:hypothetical protein
MIEKRFAYVVTGRGRAAVSVRLPLAVSVGRLSGVGICSWHEGRPATSIGSATPSFVARLCDRSGDISAMKVNEFDTQPVPGLTVWRSSA